MMAAEIGVMLFMIYLGIGLIFGLAFIAKGAATIDKDMQDASIGLRLLLFPGSILLWPLLSFKWIQKR